MSSNNNSIQSVDAPVHAGGCACGAYRFQVQGNPFHILACHCDFCRRSSGTDFQIHLFYRQSSLIVEKGSIEAHVFEYVSPDHGRKLWLEHCPTCSTRVGIRIERAPGLTLVPGGIFDQLDWYSVGVHQFVGQAEDWMTFAPGIQCFLQGSVDEAGKPLQPMEICNTGKFWTKADVVRRPAATTTQPPPHERTGSCLCGRVSFTVSRPPRKSAVCHCLFCQHSGGSAHSILAFQRTQDVTFTGSGSRKEWLFTSPIHKRQVIMESCSNCHTRILARAARMPGILLLSAGLFNDRNWPSPLGIFGHQFVGYAPKWMAMPQLGRFGQFYGESMLTEEDKPSVPLGVGKVGGWKVGEALLPRL